MKRRTLLLSPLLLPLARALTWRAEAADTVVSHGIARYDDPLKYPADFAHFAYVNPDAPKGGLVRTATVGTFDNLNGFILKGVPFVKVSNDLMQSGALYDSLLTGSLDEPLSAYGLVAETVEYPEDRSWIIFTMRREAHFHDGSPVTPDDVVWTFNTLLSKGRPQYRIAFADVDKVEALDQRRVKFSFKPGASWEMPLNVGGLPILPRKWWDGKVFDQPTLEKPLGSGPYRIAEVDPGRSMTWELVKDYWAKDLPAAKGMANVATVRVDYFRDTTALFEAFKAGQLDIREENVAKSWATLYDFPAVKQGLVIKEVVAHRVPQGMQNFVFNTRREIFKDVRVRQALGYLLDFEWLNKNFFFGDYTRTRSYWENSDLASRGLPEGTELALLETYRGRIPDAVFTTEFKPPVYDGSGNIRDGIREALKLFKEAGWSPKDGKLVNDKTGAGFTFEFLTDEPTLERVILPYLKNLERIGITASLRSVDNAQYENRRRDYDFDMLWINRGASLAPGIELRDLFGSAAAKEPDSANLSGIADPVVDELIEKAIVAKTRAELVPIIHALDRVLLQGYYGVALWYFGKYRVAYWNKFGRPPEQPPYASTPASVFPDWWIDTTADQKLSAAQQQQPAQQ
ncbi:MAG: ABC transporter substrate-binding protein [Alphaproteobacteria bacterium]|nr:ABC transporter substrate-binding protein [Alphaproteobacteria bacterium]